MINDDLEETIVSEVDDPNELTETENDEHESEEDESNDLPV